MTKLSGIAVRFAGVSRHFGDVRAVDGVSFDIQDGEFFSMLGPSGSGKTTCLRLIAGFEQPDAGSIVIHGANVEGVPPYQRDVNTVFQDYALFPHMTVAENVEYGLMIRKVPTAERHRRAQEMLALVKLEAMGARKPNQLSGGQRQRVALARALAIEPRILLLDEPFGALDAKVRLELRLWLRRLHDEIHLTSVFVTHDQEEALEVADRVAIMNRGAIEQEGSPDDVIESPATPFVVEFLATGNIQGRIDGLEPGVVRIELGPESQQLGLRRGDRVYLRPRRVRA